MRKLLIQLIVLGSMTFVGMSVHAKEVPLQQLIDETPANGVLKLEGKTYEGNVIIDKPITITGQKGTHIKGDKTKTVIEIDSDSVTLDMMHVSGSGMDQSSHEEYSGIRVIGKHAVLKNISITDVFHGIFLSRADGTTIDHARIVGQNSASLAKQGNGIHIVRANDNVIKNSFIEKTRDGIYVEYSNGNKITNNHVTKTRYGLHYMYSDDNEFHDNDFVGNVGGAAIMQSDSLLLENNNFSFNQGSRSFGLIVQTSREVHVLNNKFYQNQRGLYLEQSTSNTMEGNEFFHNQIGIELWTSSTSQVFFDNIFSKNNTNAVTIGGESFNEWFKNGKGNYWDEPMLDLDRDGFGDEPYEYRSTIGELLQENELAYLFLSSPAIHIYERANSLLGNQEVMTLDKYPRMANGNMHYTPIWSAILIITAVSVFVYVRKRRRA
ncbi:nitrous oxide reductase family maturation protein NosD [Lentibacillus sp. N15]|uniref:nitrous oxide reductase family maturation protein NosD n=1 Tax=Lentibacillus songyuanensis TaxID=3136161 RepID=UPI0031BA46EF